METFPDAIPDWFLVLGLIFPRLTLFCTWMWGHIPANDNPLFVDAIAAFCVPRFLIAYYMAEHGMVHTMLFWMYIGFGVLELLTASSKTRS